jgi:ADP-ribose pyrophosphatase YjhB (NUDIX family)
MVFNRRRGTVIVEFPDGILVVSQESESFMLAGGGANKGESRRKAAMRELQEETRLKK